MKLKDLSFEYPEHLVATEPSRPTRVMVVDSLGEPKEIAVKALLDRIPPGDVLIRNNTKVQKRRVFAVDQNEEIEILFLDYKNNEWSVLFPSKKYKVGDSILLPNGSRMTLVNKGLPQKVKVEPELTDFDFDKIGEMPLPPYIQKSRGFRHTIKDDQLWYQTAWAEKMGSAAAPTASLHFTAEDMQYLKNKGVDIIDITLHVGLGTFLPVKVDDLDDHVMHEEYYEVSASDWQRIVEAKSTSKGIWALGTTATRTVETVARTQKLSGFSQLLLQPGSEFLIVNRLLTNFHQPESTLLALVSAFSSLSAVKKCYQWAIERQFKLFSYGDLSVWIK